MKKTEKKNNKKRYSENESLERQLGSFGLEPPTIYRESQREVIADKKRTTKNNNNKKRKSNKSSQNNYKTTTQKRADENKKRALKKKQRKVLYIILLVIGIVAVLAVLCLTVFFKIETINITGNDKYSNDDIIAVLSIEQDDNLFLADLTSAEEKLEASLPYIYDVQVTRKFPSTINVNITEAKRIYALKNSDKTYTLLDANMKVLEPATGEKPKGSIVIKKATLSTAEKGSIAQFADEQMQTDILNITSAIESIALDEVTAIYSTDINNNYIVYDSRITVKLGSTENVEDKIYSALTAIDKLNETNPQAQGEMIVSGDKQIYFTEKK